MNISTEKKPVAFNVKRIILISALILCLGLTAFGSQMVYSMLTYDRIYNGVTVSSLNLGGMTVDSAREALKEKLEENIKNYVITLDLDGTEAKIEPSEISLRYDYQAIAESAMSVGRDGSFFERIIAITTAGRGETVLPLKPQYDSKQLLDKISTLHKEIAGSVVQPEITVDTQNVIIKSGKTGKDFDVSEVIASIQKATETLDTNPIKLSIKTISPDVFTADEIMKKVYQEPQDASFKVENNQLKITPHKDGRSIPLDVAEKASKAMKSQEGSIQKIPMVIKPPSVSDAQVNSMLFKDVLCSYTTLYNNALVERSNNVRLAAAKINEKIFAPGDIFSYNTVVGPRLVETGFQEAKTYQNGKIVPDIGGGICQVSSTLYYNVIYSNLEIVQRRNHQFTVAYVPLGFDATVAYGSTDFQFKNNMQWPIKIQAYASGGHLTISILGTKTNPNLKVTTRSETLKVMDFTEKLIPDPLLKPGERKVTQAGGKGYLVKVYRIVKDGTKPAVEESLGQSYYTPLFQEVHVGPGTTPTGTAVPVTPPAATPAPDVPPENANPPAPDVPQQ